MRRRSGHAANEPRARTSRFGSSDDHGDEGQEERGKSTTIANRSRLCARRPEVTLADLDLRGPRLDQFFNIDREPGLTWVESATRRSSTALCGGGHRRTAPTFSRGRTVRLGGPTCADRPFRRTPASSSPTSRFASLLDGSPSEATCSDDGPPLLGFGDAFMFSLRGGRNARRRSAEHDSATDARGVCGEPSAPAPARSSA